MGGALAFSCSNCRFGVLAVDKGVGILANNGFDHLIVAQFQFQIHVGVILQVA